MTVMPKAASGYFLVYDDWLRIIGMNILNICLK